MKKIKLLLSTLLILVLFSMISCSSGPNFSYEDTKLNQKLTINFETNGGTSKESKTFESGTDVSEIVDYLNNVPTKESAEFRDWFGLEGVFEHSYCVQIDSNHWSYETNAYFYNPNHVCSEDCCYRVRPGFQKETITLVALWKSDSPSIIINNSDLDFSLDNADNVQPYYIFSSGEYLKSQSNKTDFYNSEYELLSSRIIKDGYFCDFFVRTNYYPGDIDFVCTPNFKPAKNITFESNGGTACEKMIFGESFDIKELPTPTKENYCFVGKSAFANCSELTSIKLPDSVLTIGSSAFKECKKLTNVTLPKWIEILPSSIFSNCSVLKSISIPNAVENIEDNAFLGCIALESIVIPENVITLGSSAFSGCASLVTIENLQMLESIEQQAFKVCIVFETITLPTCFESIGREAFFNCKALKQLLLPENVSSIGESAFISCVSLEKINIPSKVKTLSAHVFHQCTSLISITIDEGVETILDRAFFECKKLQSIVLPSSLKVIDTSVFLNCTSLKAITIPEKVYKIGNGIIVGCSSISSVEFKNTTDWYSTENPNYKGGETFDTSNTSKNVSSLKNEKLFLYNSVLKDLEDQTNNVYSL